MPWVRIDENAMDHPKFIAISPNAWRLWCEGLSYCQKHLTDGFIPRQGAKGLRYYSPASLKMLLASLVPGKGPLWHESDGGYTVHDYHDWNESRDRVLQARSESRDRRRKWRERHASQDALPATEQTPNGVRGVVWSREKETSQQREGGSGETVDRVQGFVDRYRALHEQYIGVAYIGNPVKDYSAACELVAAFDDGMLDAIAVYGLNDPDEFMAKDTRTLTKLKSRASGYARELKARKLA